MNFPRGTTRRRTMSLESGGSPLTLPGYLDDPTGCNPAEPVVGLCPGTGAATCDTAKDWNNPAFGELAPHKEEYEQEAYTNQEWIPLEPTYENMVHRRYNPEPNLDALSDVITPFDSRALPEPVDIYAGTHRDQGATSFADGGYEVPCISPFYDEPPSPLDNPPMDWRTIDWRPPIFPLPAIPWRQNLMTDWLAAIIISLILACIHFGKVRPSTTRWK